MKREPRMRGWRQQRGATAVEFAIVFPLFFLIFYAILTFGMIFAIKQSLMLAAAEGARAALNYTSTPCDRLQASTGAQQVAKNVMTNSYGVLGAGVLVDVQASTQLPVPQAVSGVTCPSTFASTSASPFYVMVTVTYQYEKPQNQLIPWLFGDITVPQLQSSATVQISPSML